MSYSIMMSEEVIKLELTMMKMSQEVVGSSSPIMHLVMHLECQLMDCTLGQGQKSGTRYRTIQHLQTIEQTENDMNRHIRFHELIILKSGYAMDHIENRQGPWKYS